MAEWQMAESLNRLLAQLNALAPRRSKASDGGVGDLRHSTQMSDHNPWYGPGIVTARDFTNDPAGGLDCAKLRDSLIRSKDSRIKYVIFNRSIISGAGGPQPWVARRYDGVNAHTKHLHLSVVADKRCRDTSPWMLPGLTGSTEPPTSGVYCQLRDRNDRVMKLQQFMTSAFTSYNAYRPTGFYGLATRDGVYEFQRRTGIAGPDANGETVGPRTLAKLREFGFQP